VTRSVLEADGNSRTAGTRCERQVAVIVLRGLVAMDVMGGVVGNQVGGVKEVGMPGGRFRLTPSRDLFINSKMTR
jgi:hypothetical protein